MRKQYTYKPVALRFRRWSRKRYAAFISIQHAVTIGQLSANVSERFQAKNGSVHCSKDITLSLLLQALCPVQIANRPAASYAHIIKDNISEIAEGPSYKLKAFRDFRLYKYPNT